MSAAVAAGRYICVLDREQAARRDAAMRAQAGSAAPETAGDLIPAISNGIVATGTTAAGERFIQPRVKGVLLDDATGGGWRLFVNNATDAERTRTHVGKHAANLRISVIDISTLDDGGTVRDWLQARSAGAVLIRPDFYVFGTGAEATPLVSSLVTALSDTASAPRERAA
jgi:3-(3-hydroxy-phenyl)propionate hydroxylase